VGKEVLFFESRPDVYKERKGMNSTCFKARRLDDTQRERESCFRIELIMMNLELSVRPSISA
jgi:hypothetical protein